LVFWIFSVPTFVCSRVGPDGRTRVICFGDVIDQSGSFNSFTIIEVDPAINPTFVPCRPDYLGGVEKAWRNLRIYMPRTYERLVGGFDVIMTSDLDLTVFKADWVDWLARSVREAGLGHLWLGNIFTSSQDNWEGTVLADVAPVTPVLKFYIEGAFRLRVEDASEELMQSLPWEGSPPITHFHAWAPKQGSRVWASLSHQDRYPLMTYWKTEEGAVLCFSGKFPGGVRTWARDWQFFPQAMMYMTYRVAGKALPSDPYLFAQLTTGFIEFNEMNSLLQSLLDWVEKAGGSPRKLYARLETLRQIKEMADDHYLGGDLELALAALRDAKPEQESLREAALRAKDAALFWTYMIEWFSLLGALLASSLVTWSLMIQRRLYREVSVSRLPHGAE